jgi:Co/Zn/Cd efflux system component
MERSGISPGGPSPMVLLNTVFMVFEHLYPSYHLSLALIGDAPTPFSRMDEDSISLGT